MSANAASPTKAGRPSLSGSMRSRSYLQDHQQYRPPQQDGHHQGIDSIVEGLQNSSITPPPASGFKFNGIPSPHSPPQIIDSGLIHTLSHSHCQPTPGTVSDRIVATIFYRSKPRENITPGTSSPASTTSTPPTSNKLPAGLAPVRTLSNFPLEPPASDSEPLDHLYGSYVSQLCLTSFLAMISSLPLPRNADGEQATLSSSHRCLDTPVHPRVVELNFSPAPDPTYITLDDLRRHEQLFRFESEWNVDVVLQPDTVFRRHPRLVVFDMDSTLIREEVIDLIAASINVEGEVSAITARAMNGELDFSASLRERVALLKGVQADIFTKLRDVITPTTGAAQLIRALRKLGVKTAVCSGGFIPLTSWLASELGIDFAYANTLTIADGTLTGQVEGAIVDAKRKADLLVEIAEKEGIDRRQTLAVGDGANDLLMMAEAGLGVAFNAKPRVQLEAEARLNGESLVDLLYLMGFTAEEIAVLSS